MIAYLVWLFAVWLASFTLGALSGWLLLALLFREVLYSAHKR